MHLMPDRLIMRTLQDCQAIWQGNSRSWGSRNGSVVSSSGVLQLGDALWPKGVSPAAVLAAEHFRANQP